MYWCKLQATIQHSSCGGVIDAKWTLYFIELRKNPELYFLKRPQQVVIQIIDDMNRGNNMKPTHSGPQFNPQGALLWIRPTL